MSEENKAIASRFNEFSHGNLALLDELAARDCVFHGAEAWGVPPTVEGIKTLLAGTLASLADPEDSIELCFADGDLVFMRHKMTFTHVGEFVGSPATDERVSVVGHNVQRIVDGKVAEFWGLPEIMGKMQQIGVIPSPGQGGR
jgi:predicted ester cyclase